MGDKQANKCKVFASCLHRGRTEPRLNARLNDRLMTRGPVISFFYSVATMNEPPKIWVWPLI